MPRESGFFTNGQVRQRIRSVTSPYMGRGGGTNLRLAIYENHMTFQHPEHPVITHASIADLAQIAMAVNSHSPDYYLKISAGLNSTGAGACLRSHNSILFIHKFKGHQINTRQVIVIWMGDNTSPAHDISDGFGFNLASRMPSDWADDHAQPFDAVLGFDALALLQEEQV